MMLWLRVFLVIVLVVSGFQRKYIDTISFDNIQYGSIDIPQNAQSLNLLLWAHSSVVQPVYALIGIGRIPTTDSFDSMIELPALPSTLQILQPNPPAGKIFVGIWGGKLLHSYRYFAGDRAISSIGMQYQLSTEVSSSQALATSFTIESSGYFIMKDSIAVNDVSSFSILVSSKTDRLHLEYSINNNSLNCQFSNPNGDLVLVLQSYFDAMSKDSSSLAKYYGSVKRLKKFRLCDPSYLLNQTALNLDIPFPTAGMWTVTTSLLEINAYEAQNLRKSRSQADSRKNWWSPVLLITNRTTATEQSFVSADLESAYTNEILEMRDASFERSISWQQFTTEANGKVNSMNSFLFTAFRQEYVGGPVPFLSSHVQGSHVRDLSVSYTVTIPANPGFATANLFAGVIVQLYLRVSSHDTVVLNRVSSLPWFLAMRIGNIPYKKLIDGNSFFVADSLFPIHRENCSEFLPCTSTENLQTHSYSSLSNPDIHVLRYDWFWPRPYLNHFNTRGDAFDFSRQLFFRVILGHGNDTEGDAVEASLQELFNQGTSIEIEIKLTADACAALGSIPCAHGGKCVATTNAAAVSGSNSDSLQTEREWMIGDAVITAQCQCRYPWAGAYCTTLAVPTPVYTFQVIVLVLTNSMMLPVVILAVHHRLYLLTVGLAASALSSAVYHLCDMEVYCLAGLSFASLHVLDVLFSVAMIASIVLFLAPMPRSVHSAVCLGVLSLLVAPVMNDPTNALVLILTIALSGIAVVVRWSVVLNATGKNIHQLQLSTRIVHEDSGPVYTTIPVVDDMSPSIVQDREIADGGDIEMESVSNPLVADTGSSLLPSQPSQQDTRRTEPEQNLSSPEFTWKQLIGQSSDVVIGAAIGMIGLSSYALDNRTNYWYLHSLWHIFMMTAAFFLLRGRMRIFTYFHIDDAL